VDDDGSRSGEVRDGAELKPYSSTAVRSGYGKSTLLRCVNALEPIQAGTISSYLQRTNDS
jgi:ABC-type polar amino acid transport system ATPase subunit